jgi:predicted dithiol-disulfide oxidoreductase (DUF899 family)
MNDEVLRLEKEIEALTEQLFAARAAATAEAVGSFVFETAAGPVSLAELFGDRDELVLVHNMGVSCSYCTMWADCLESTRRHIESRCALVMVTPDSAEVQAKVASERGWSCRMVTDATREFSAAMGYWSEADGWWPGVSTFRRGAGGSVVRTGKAVFGPGDAFCSPWHFFSLLGIRDGDWSPK